MRIRLALVGVIVATSTVVAQPSDPRQRGGGYIGKDIPLLEIDDCPPVPQVADDRLRQIGSEHYQRGEVLYVQGDYRGAVKELVASYCLIPFYSILKDIGQAYERELDYARAIAYLERYVLAVPKDAQRTSACATDPQEDKKNVLARIAVLSSLKAKIRVDTDHPDAQIALADENGMQARGISGQELEVAGGNFVLTVALDGFHTVTREVHADIGKPYTFFERLEPLMGRLKVRVTPADARLFIDKRSVGTGSYESELPGGSYTLVAEASDHVTVTREVEVLANKDTDVAFELPPQPQIGRRQLLGYMTLMGATAGGMLAGAQDTGYILGGVGLGGGAGFFGTLFGIRRDVPLGTSSFTITSSLIGGTVGAGVAGLTTTSNNVSSALIGSGLVLGAGAGYYLGDRFHLRPGEAAIINTGALWGTIAGVLFFNSFSGTTHTERGALLLSGLGMGTVSGALVTRYFTISRSRAALIDVGGAVGMLVGVAAESFYSQNTSASGTNSTNTERVANFAIGGLAAGLILSGVLTRNMDAPNLGNVAPAMGKATTAGGGSTTTFGIGGTF